MRQAFSRWACRVVLLSGGLATLVACGGASPTSSPSPVATEPLSSCDLSFEPAATSEYVLPYEVSTTRTVIQTYCPPNPAWGHHGAYAFDFDMPIGTPIVASRGGVVYFVKEQREDGDRTEANGIGIEHADGTVIQYFHLTKDGSFVEVGDRVERGQVIGLSGNTGPSSGPHLHIWLLRSRSQASKRDSLPISFRNAQGPLDSNGGLVHLASYTALPSD